jgi:hypothetical protein
MKRALGDLARNELARKAYERLYSWQNSGGRCGPLWNESTGIEKEIQGWMEPAVRLASAHRLEELAIGDIDRQTG